MIYALVGGGYLSAWIVPKNTDDLVMPTFADQYFAEVLNSTRKIMLSFLYALLLHLIYKCHSYRENKFVPIISII